MFNKHKAAQLKLAKAGTNKSPAFALIELDKAIKDLNTGRARDPSGLFAKLFKINVMGVNLKKSLLTI